MPVKINPQGNFQDFDSTLTMWDNVQENKKIMRDDKAFVSLCDALGERVSFSIIKTTIKAAKSATEISRETNYPLSSIYKKIRKLERMGIIRIQETVTDDESGKRIAYYACKIKALGMTIDEKGATRIFFKTHSNQKHTASSTE